MWLAGIFVLLCGLFVLTALWYLRYRADEDELASDREAVRRAYDRVLEHRQSLQEKAWHYELDDQRRNGNGHGRH
jgi:hypothetical protein